MQNALYNNIGSKIKILAMTLMIIETIGCIVGGLLLLMSPDSMIIGILLVLCGPIGAWLSSLLLYGFGELIETAQDMNAKIDIIEDLKKEQIMLQHDQMTQIKRIAKEHTNREVIDPSQPKV